MSDSINGGAKFFEKNYALFKDGSTALASSGSGAAKFILDISRYTQYESVGSNDLTIETITVTLKLAKLISRMFLTDFNFKKFGVQYYNGSSYVDFTSVIGVNGEAKTGINETDYPYDSGYYEFDPVTTSKIKITCHTTQIADMEKFLGQFIATEEIGTFEGFPVIKPRSNRNETKTRVLSKRYSILKTYETNRVLMNFKYHPYQNDLDIIETLFEREEPFLVFLCGGRTGTDYFKMKQKGWNLNDVYNMQILGYLKNEWEKGIYTLGFNKQLIMEEHI